MKIQIICMINESAENLHELPNIIELSRVPCVGEHLNLRNYVFRVFEVLHNYEVPENKTDALILLDFLKKV